MTWGEAGKNEENEADARGERIWEGSKELLMGCEL